MPWLARFDWLVFELVGATLDSGTGVSEEGRGLCREVKRAVGSVDELRRVGLSPCELGAACGRWTFLLLEVGRVGFREEEHVLGMSQSAVGAAVISSI